jgi:hypothetical protein
MLGLLLHCCFFLRTLCFFLGNLELSLFVCLFVVWVLQHFFFFVVVVFGFGCFFFKSVLL